MCSKICPWPSFLFFLTASFKRLTPLPVAAVFQSQEGYRRPPSLKSTGKPTYSIWKAIDLREKWSLLLSSSQPHLFTTCPESPFFLEWYYYAAGGHLSLKLLSQWFLAFLKKSQTPLRLNGSYQLSPQKKKHGYSHEYLLKISRCLQAPI